VDKVPYPRAAGGSAMKRFLIGRTTFLLVATVVFGAMLFPALRQIFQEKASGLGVVISWQTILYTFLLIIVLGIVSFWFSGKVIEFCRSTRIRMTMQSTERTIRKVTEADLKVGLICADRDGNRIRVDNVERDDRGSGTVSYHFLNDELRVQEGVQERTIEQFLAEGWVIAAAGTSL
jgi:hypothetical protein